MRLLPLVLAFLALVGSAHAQAIRGPARVIDGDTLEVDGRRVRLWGIDAPEAAQTCLREGQRWPCGAAAAEHLRSLIGGRAVACTPREAAAEGPVPAVCTSGDAELNAAMVSAGYALALWQVSADYEPGQQAARAAGKGIWAGPFMEPWEWRKGFRLEGAPAAAPAPPPTQPAAAPTPAPDRSRCRIKGNISGRGKFYHTPDSPWYGRTKIDEAAGERWFCTEEEARAAGWRAPGG